MPAIHNLPHGTPTKVDVGSTEGESGNVFESAVYATRMPMLITDPRQADNPIVFCNPAFCAMTGYSREELIGRNCRLLQGSGTDPATVRKLSAAIKALQPVDVEIVNYRKPEPGQEFGEPFLNALFVTPIFDRNNELAFFFASQIDITAERTAEANLVRSQRMQALGALSAGVAHDLNNMLQIISGQADMLSRVSSDPAKRAASAQRMHDGIERAVKLVQQLLAFGRQQTLNAAPVNLNTVVANTLTMARSALGSPIQIHTRLGRELATVLLDRHQAEQAIYNILLNAKAALERGGHIDISTANLLIAEGERGQFGGLPAGPYVSLRVTDNGSGMTPDVLARATEPFFTTKGDGGLGHGMGLAQVHGFVQQSEGWLGLQSAPGQGTTVTMCFPAAEVGDDEAETSGTGSGEARRTVMLVEDDEAVLDMLTTFLSVADYDVIAHQDPEQAVVELAGTHRIDLMVTDFRMPRLNGAELAHKARQFRPGLPILMLTGYATPGAVKEAGEFEVMAKPVRLEPFLRRVRESMLP